MIIKEKTPSYGVANREGATGHERQVCFVLFLGKKHKTPLWSSPKTWNFIEVLGLTLNLLWYCLMCKLLIVLHSKTLGG